MRSLAMSFVILTLASFLNGASAADGQPWQIVKATGEVRVTKGEQTSVSLTSGSELQAGDTIQTGPNGRVMLTRGEERIVVSPNTSIGVPLQGARYPTSITQNSGTIFLEVERKNVQHFEVETPYLAAVVKGTMFRVTVDKRGSKVDVLRGQVQVSDFKTGQMALVAPGQAARVRAVGVGGLSLSGRGKFGPIERGMPRASSVRAALPKPAVTALARASEPRPNQKSLQQLGGRNVRIGSAIGEVKLDLHKVTKGLAHNSNQPRTQTGSGSASSEIGFNSGSLNATSNAQAFVGNAPGRGSQGNSATAAANNGNGNSASNGNGNGAASAVAQGSNNKKGDAANATADEGNSTGNGKGNNGNGKGNGGGNGAGNANGNGNGKGKNKS